MNPRRKKSYATREKHLFFLVAQYTIFPCCIRFLFHLAVKKWIFLLAGQKMNFFYPQMQKRLYGTLGKHLFYSYDCYPRFASASNFTLAK